MLESFDLLWLLMQVLFWVECATCHALYLIGFATYCRVLESLEMNQGGSIIAMAWIPVCGDKSESRIRPSGKIKPKLWFGRWPGALLISVSWPRKRQVTARNETCLTDASINLAWHWHLTDSLSPSRKWNTALPNTRLVPPSDALSLFFALASFSFRFYSLSSFPLFSQCSIPF